MRFFLRRKYLVSRSQLHLLAFNVFYYVVFTMVLSAVLLAPLVLSMTDGGVHTDRASVARVLLYVNARIWPVAGVMIAVSAVHSVFITHRVVGPLVRFRRVFREIAAGRLSHRLVLRPRDYLDEDAEDLNAMSVALVLKAEELRTCQRHLLDELGDVERALRTGADAASELAALRTRLAELEHALDRLDGGAGDSVARVDVDASTSLVGRHPKPTQSAPRPS